MHTQTPEHTKWGSFNTTNRSSDGGPDEKPLHHTCIFIMGGFKDLILASPRNRSQQRTHGYTHEMTQWTDPVVCLCFKTHTQVCIHSKNTQAQCDALFKAIFVIYRIYLQLLFTFFFLLFRFKIFSVHIFKFKNHNSCHPHALVLLDFSEYSRVKRQRRIWFPSFWFSQTYFHVWRSGAGKKRKNLNEMKTAENVT